MNSKSIQKFRISFVTAVLAVLPFTSALHAQDQTLRVKVDVPFAFDSGLKHFAAGVYDITLPTQHVILINSANRKSGNAMVYVSWQQDLERATRGRIVFRKYGDQYFLHSVFFQGKQNHLEFAPSKAEKQVQQNLKMASVDPPMDRVEVALLAKR